jgi:hypothetical protein
VLGEDVEDHGRAVHDARLEPVLERALLARAEGPLGGDQVGIVALDRGLQLLEPPPAEVGARHGVLAALHQGLEHLGARRAQQLAELGQAVALLGVARHGGDHDRALGAAPVELLLGPRGRAAVGALQLLHPTMMPALAVGRATRAVAASPRPASPRPCRADCVPSAR